MYICLYTYTYINIFLSILAQLQAGLAHRCLLYYFTTLLLNWHAQRSLPGAFSGHMFSRVLLRALNSCKV